jgi:radical SAM protein with 4Fe4S-binding SPASM domain
MTAAALHNPMQLEKPIKLTVSYTHSCPLDCRHCYADCGNSRGQKELTAEQWRPFLDERIEDGTMAILFEGGEPLHRADFLGVLKGCSDRVISRVRTNGWLITGALAHELKQAGVGTVLVDFMGARAETHDWFAQRSGAFDRARKALDHLLAAGVATQALIILNRRNVGELQEFVELVHGHGVSTVGVLRLYPIGRAKHAWKELSLTLGQQMSALEALQLPPGVKLMQSWHPNNGNCCWQMAAVNAWGDSIGCSYLREYVNYGNVLQTDFMQTWQHPLYRELRAGKVEDSCGDCSSREGSHGGCRSTAFAFHGRWSAPDPYDITLNKGVDLRDLPQRVLQARPRPPDSSTA